MNLWADRLYALWQAVWQRISWQMLFVFGAGHLIGINGVLQLLSDAGYKVEQIKYPHS